MIELKLRVVGNSFIVTIPKSIVRDLRLGENDSLLMDVRNKTIVVRKKPRDN